MKAYQKVLCWIPVAGAVIELSFQELYLADPAHPVRFILSAFFHAAWFFVIMLALGVFFQ